MSQKLTYLIFPKATINGGWKSLFDNLYIDDESFSPPTLDQFEQNLKESLAAFNIAARFKKISEVSLHRNNDYVQSRLAVIKTDTEINWLSLRDIKTNFSVRSPQALIDYAGHDVASRYLAS